MSTKAKFNCQDIRLTGRFERKLDELINGRRSTKRHSHFKDTQKNMMCSPRRRRCAFCTQSSVQKCNERNFSILSDSSVLGVGDEAITSKEDIPFVLW